MQSQHAFVTLLATNIAIQYGIRSDYFAKNARVWPLKPGRSDLLVLAGGQGVEEVCTWVLFIECRPPTLEGESTLGTSFGEQYGTLNLGLAVKHYPAVFL